MSKVGAIFSYSIGKKLIMALTGLFLILFLLEHMIANLMIIIDLEAFAEYAYFMGHNVVIRIAEVGLFAFFIFHIADGLWLARKNKAARSQGYAVSAGNKNASWFSKNMQWTGIVILVFLVLHLISFWLLGRLNIDVPMGIDNSLYAMLGEGSSPIAHEQMLAVKIVLQFQVWWYSLIYILAMAFVGFHLNHGFQSAFQSLGIYHSKFNTLIKRTGTALAILIPAGFATIPMYVLVDTLLA